MKRFFFFFVSFVVLLTSVSFAQPEFDEKTIEKITQARNLEMEQVKNPVVLYEAEEVVDPDQLILMAKANQDEAPEGLLVASIATVDNEEIPVYTVTQLLKRVQYPSGFIVESYASTAVSTNWKTTSGSGYTVASRINYNIRLDDIYVDIQMSSGQGRVTYSATAPSKMDVYTAIESSDYDEQGSEGRTYSSPSSGQIYSCPSPHSLWMLPAHNLILRAATDVTLPNGSVLSVESMVDSHNVT